MSSIDNNSSNKLDPVTHYVISFSGSASDFEQEVLYIYNLNKVQVVKDIVKSLPAGYPPQEESQDMMQIVFYNNTQIVSVCTMFPGTLKVDEKYYNINTDQYNKIINTSTGHFHDSN